jgi:hypothetical protein
LRKSQSPWAGYSTPADDPIADIARRSQADAGRLDATCVDDATWFDEHPDRDFHIREATPHERDIGFAQEAVLAVRLPNIGQARIPLEVYWGKLSDYDNDAIGELLFEECMRRLDPNVAAVARDARKGARRD